MSSQRRATVCRALMPAQADSTVGESSFLAASPNDEFNQRYVTNFAMSSAMITSKGESGQNARLVFIIASRQLAKSQVS